MITVISIAVKMHIPCKKQLEKKAIHRIAMTREDVLKECELYEKSEDEKLGLSLKVVKSSLEKVYSKLADHGQSN